MSTSLILDEGAYAVWQQVAKLGRVDVAEITKLTGLDQSKVIAIATEAEKNGLMKITSRDREEIVRADGAAEAVRRGLPERWALALLSKKGGTMPMSLFIALAKDNGIPVNAVFKWGKVRGWLERNDDKIRLTDAGQKAVYEGGHDADERALLMDRNGPIYLDDIEDGEHVRSLLQHRSELARIKKRSQRTLSLTDAGLTAFTAAIKLRTERNVLTSEDLQSGAWSEITLRPYDVTLPAQTVYPAKINPLRKIIEQTRRAFLEMGFTEVVSPMVESSFWCFDALFQPQDHPAREMQDTFYMDEPREMPLPKDSELVERVKRTHEDGGETGSEGWGYRWEPRRAVQAVLRTHTTAATVRALAAHPSPPLKVFCVGWVFRNETMSFKHLPVFHQVDGIVIDENANLASLLGTLATFYKKMGFQRVKFKPAFYPYTEPSVDVVVYMETRDRWIEMGGSGIFRPEVTEPLGCRHPVLAWGLGMERLAMIRYGLTDIRDLFQGDLDSMREVPLCR